MPTKIAYTAARRVPIYRDVSGGGTLVPFAPKRKLDSNTRVELVYNTTMMANGVPYVWANVLDGIHSGTNGYIPRYGVHGGYVQGLTGAHGERFTGVKYGAYKETSDASRARDPDDVTLVGVTRTGAVDRASKADEEANFVELVMARANTCPYCGGDRGDHKLLETVEARDLVTAIHDDLRTVPVGGAFMMGVLIAYGRAPRKGTSTMHRYFATSDAAGGNAVTRATAYCTNNNITFVAKAAVDRTFLNFEGDEIKIPHVTADQALSCAAPKLIQYFLQNKPSRVDAVYLSEIWYKAGTPHSRYTDRGTIDSCDRCRLVVPPMLCGLRNPYSKRRLGRFKSWQSISEFVMGE